MDDERTKCDARNWWHSCDLDLAHEGQHECRCSVRFDLRGVRVELGEGE